ncbi:MAG: hypothetical protein CO141_01455 [Candidatus Moranbacteria bacterium CG_4_9_14_3_um_filter_42_9]|nr:MAG: hypothetical protein CO141_01455 [Candidatus Moranbacteria bacterium CG_4_9_14_3_um_filter_42_9]
MAEEQNIQPQNSEATVLESKNNQNIVQDQGDKYTLEEQTDNNTKEIERLKRELSNERFNTITIFGVFASLVTFFSVEIQIFKNIENFWLLIGLTSFLVSSLLLFVFSIHAIVRDKLKWRDFFTTPIFWIFLMFLIFAFTIFFLNSKGINIDLKIQNR